MIYIEQPENFVPDIEVVGCIVELDNRILLLHRLNHKTQGGRWGIPAGKLDKEDCNYKFAMVRELYEETGLKISENDLVFHRTFYVEYPDKKYLYHYHKVDICDNFDVKIEDNEHQNFAWVTKEEALQMPLVIHEDFCIKDFYGIK